MERKNPCAGSSTVGVSLAIFLVIFTLSTLYVFIEKPEWAQFPAPITSFGREIDQQFHRTLIITGIVFVLSQLGLAWVVFRYRDRGQRAQHIEGNQVMEVLWTLATLVLFVGLGIYAERAWAEVHFRSAAPGALQIEVTGQQFAWNFRYPGPDGKFGRIDPKLVNASGGNPLGLDPSDPAGKDDVVVPVMAIPVNREVELLIRSQDVTHSFFVRELRLKQDAVPGMLIRIHFTATQLSPPDKPFEIPCAELCGLGHYRMRSFLSVMSQEDFDKWLREQAAANQ